MRAYTVEDRLWMTIARRRWPPRLSQIEKQFGKGSVMRLGDAARHLRRRGRIPTGSLGLDIALGVGGTAARPRDRDLRPRILGQDHADAAGHRRDRRSHGGTAAFVDAEHALDPAYAEKLGVNVKDLLVSQPDTGEQALEITDMLVRSGAVDVVVIDSVAALTPKAEIEGEMGDLHIGLQARLMSQALRKLTGNIKRSNTIVIFINQIRMKIGVMFGNPETTTGGNALKFYASVRLDIRRIGAIKNGEEVVGNADARQGGEEQGGAAVPRSRVRDHVRHRASRARARSSSSACCTTSSRSPAPGTATTASGSARARTTRALPAAAPEIAADIEEQIRAKLMPEKATMNACRGQRGLEPGARRERARTMRARRGSRRCDALARRDHASAELRAKLTRPRATTRRSCAPLIERLIAEKLLDDRRYVRQLCRCTMPRAARGRERVRRGTAQARAAGRDRRGSLGAIPDWATQLAGRGKRNSAPAPAGEFAGTARQARFLRYRGFTSAHIRSALGFDTDLDADDEDHEDETQDQRSMTQLGDPGELSGVFPQERSHGRALQLAGAGQ